MSNKIDFELEGVKHSLRFGMTSVRILEQKSIHHTNLHNGEELSNIDMFINVVYSGLCNHADVVEENRPSWSDAYDISEQLLLDADLQKKIFDVWEDSKPVKEMMQRLKSIGETKKKQSQK